MSPMTPTAYYVHRDDIERRMRAGEPFASIESAIESATATDDEKAALWLLAWSEQPRRVRRRLVTDVLAHADRLA